MAMPCRASPARHALGGADGDAGLIEHGAHLGADESVAWCVGVNADRLGADQYHGNSPHPRTAARVRSPFRRSWLPEPCCWLPLASGSVAGAIDRLARKGR